MKHLTYLACLYLLLIACGERTGDGTIQAGMKWSLAQRDLQNSGWNLTVEKPKPSSMKPDAGGRVYRYANESGEVVDYVTEEVGKIEKIYRMFDGNGKELESVTISRSTAD